jgi:hypothetical protein
VVRGPAVVAAPAAVGPAVVAGPVAVGPAVVAVVAALEVGADRKAPW